MGQIGHGQHERGRRVAASDCGDDAACGGEIGATAAGRLGDDRGDQPVLMQRRQVVERERGLAIDTRRTLSEALRQGRQHRIEMFVPVREVVRGHSHEGRCHEVRRGVRNKATQVEWPPQRSRAGMTCKSIGRSMVMNFHSLLKA